MDVVKVTEVKIIPKSACNITQPGKAIQRNPIILTDFDHDYISDEIKWRGEYSTNEISVFKMMYNLLF